jgi:hypothetical protein
MVHSPDVAAQIDGDCITGFDQSWLDHIFGGVHLVGVDHSGLVYGPHVFCQFKNLLPGLHFLESAGCQDCFCIFQLEGTYA